jgi:DNA-binding response OmpR family regulator
MNYDKSEIKSFKILLVEDEEKVRIHLGKSLRYLVSEVQESADGYEALERLKIFTPDIIITDIEMPNMDGIELIKNIRKNDSNTLIVVLTAYDTPEYLKKLIDLHLEHYEVKPIDFNKLINILDKCLNKITERQNIVVLKLPLGYKYDDSTKVIYFNDDKIHLTKKEIKFLDLLIKNQFRIVTYEEFQQYVWEDSIMTDNAIKSLVKNLRNKLPINLFENLSGIGYKLV